jgi:exopolyphosphatase/guanosine-5'-triphosphate,3'-diphosphate pyrophosphatase
MIRAAMDIGSNTVRLLVARVSDEGVERLELLRRITRLGGRFEGALNPDSLSRTMDAVIEFTAAAVDAGAHEIRVGCTGVVRKAADREEFIHTVTSLPGNVSACVLTGETEATLAATGAAMRLAPDFGPLVLVDIGGFSTELAEFDGEVRRRRSFDLGVVALTETSLPGDPPTQREVASVRARVRQILSPFFVEPVAGKLVGIAGTATTMAAMTLGMERYDSERIHGARVSRDDVERILVAMLSMPAEKRLNAFAGLEKGREDLMPAGAMILSAVMESGGWSGYTVSEGGLLEGIAKADAWPPFDSLVVG